MASATVTAKAPTFIDPDRLYSRRGFIAASGIAATRLREARMQGIEPNWLYVGRRQFIRGRDAIEFIERLAAAGERHVGNGHQ